MLRRLLSLVLCLSVLLMFCFARAELEVPQPKPTQEDLQTGFLANVNSLISRLNLDDNALHLEVSQADQQLLDALIQQADEYFDIDALLQNSPIHAQLAQDALFVAIEDQVYKLPFESITSMIGSMTASDGSANINPMLIYGLLTSFYESAIVPSLSVEADESSQRYIFDLTQERFNQSLVELGDTVAESDELVQMFAALGIDDFPDIWPQLRTMVEGGILQVSVHAEASMDENGTKLEANGVFMGFEISLNAAMQGAEATFDLKAGSLSVAGRINLADGGYECHIDDSNGFVYDIVFEPTDEGWNYNLVNTQQGGMRMTCDLTMSQGVLDGSAELRVSEDAESITATVHCDLSTFAFNANLTIPESMGGIVVDLNGAATETGYRVVADVLQGGAKLATAELCFTDTEELFGIELSVVSGEDEATELMKGSFALAKQTGAYTLHFEDYNGDRLDGEGEITEEHKCCTLEAGSMEYLLTRLNIDIQSDDDVYRYHYSNYQDMYYRGELSLVNEINFDLDKNTGAFRGSYEDTNAFTRCDFQGIATDGLFKLHIDGSNYGRSSGLFDLSAHWDDKHFTAEYTHSDGYDTSVGSLTWSEALKSLSFNGDRQSLYIALEQAQYGLPKALRAVVSDGRYSTTELSIDESCIRVKNGDTTTVITGHFKDEHTYCVEITSSDGFRSSQNTVDIDFTVNDDGLAVTAVDGNGVKLFEATLKPAEKTGIEPLDGREDITEITPEFIAGILETMTSGGEVYVEDNPSTDFAEDGVVDN